MTRDLLIVLLIAILICSLATPTLGITVDFSAESNGETATSLSTFSLDSAATMHSETNGWMTETGIEGAGVATHNGLFVATDQPQMKTEISSAGQIVSIKADGMEVASKSNDLIMGTSMLMEKGSLLAGPVYTESGGRKEAYQLLGYRWNTRDPQLKWVIKNDNIMKSEGLSTSSVQGAIASAANTWDSASNQNLFADSSLISLNPTVTADTYDKMNTINWRSLSTTALAYARTYYYGSRKVDGYSTAIESDIVFNSRYGWGTGGTGSGGLDVESVALHEMGHTLGLADLYGKSQFAGDTDQAMHAYNGIQRTLGNGDKTGIWKLYG